MSHYSRTRPLWISAVATPLMLAMIAALQVRIDAQTRTISKQKEELLLRSARLVKKLSLGYEPLLADIYWTRAVQYYGGQFTSTDTNFDLLYPLLDLTTTLDPKLIPAYRFGAIFLSEPPPVGAGRKDLAIQLVKRGIAANPDEWRLDADLGFLYYWHLKDYPDAAAAYYEGSKNPQAPEFMKLMAARVAEKGGSIDTSRMIWAQVYESTRDPKIRRMAIQHLQSLQALRDVTLLDQYAEDYRKRFGRYPASTKEMRDAGFLLGIPLDPVGIPYIIGPDGKARLDPKSPVVMEPEPQGPAEQRAAKN